MLVRNRKTKQEYEITQAEYESAKLNGLSRLFIVVDANTNITDKKLPIDEIKVIKKSTKK